MAVKPPATDPMADDDGWVHPSAWDMGRPDSYQNLADSYSWLDAVSDDPVPTIADDYSGADAAILGLGDDIPDDATGSGG